MNMRIKNLYFILGLIIILSVSLITPNDTSATFYAGPGNGSIDVVCGDDEYNYCDSDLNKLQLVNVVGKVFVSVYSRPFNFNVSSGGTLVSNGSVPVNSNLTFSPSGNARGTWLLTGSVYDTPDMDGVRYNTIGYNPNKQRTQGITVNPPSTSNPSSIMGSGAVSCSGWTCTANSVGSASITVTFPGGSVQSRSEPKYPNQNSNKCGPNSQYDCGYDEEIISYGTQSMTINFQVYQPNKPHTVIYTNTSNIRYNTATANWTYSDPEGDIQTNAQINIYTDSARTILARPTINQSGSATSLNITGLIPGTTYYPSVRASNGPNGWSSWSNGTPFNTPPNNPQDLDRLSCSAASGATDYERARLEWNYTGADEPRDELVLKARYRRTPEDTDWIALNLPNNATGVININNLISGFTYQVQISLNDNRNAHLGDRWKECGQVTPPNYPLPEFTFRLTGDGKTVNYNDTDKTLTIKTGAEVNANWSINNGTEVGLQQCALSTTEGNGVDLLSGTGFDGSATATGPEAPQDLTYKVRLKCEGKPAKSPVGVDQTINLKVQSVPTLSCSIENNKNLVKEGNTSITIIAQVGNISSYSWEVKRDINDVSNISSGNSPIPNRITLNYAGTAFGRYTPWVKITNQSNSITAEAECGTVTNLGDSNIREISP